MIALVGHYTALFAFIQFFHGVNPFSRSGFRPVAKYYFNTSPDSVKALLRGASPELKPAIMRFRAPLKGVSRICYAANLSCA